MQRQICRREVFPLIATFLCLSFLGMPSSARAEGISFTLSSSTVEITSGGTAVFFGTVTNNSGTDLMSSDFFFNFFGYDFALVTPNQNLGVDEFSIPDGTSSGSVDLFSVTLGAVSAGSSFPVEVQLEDVNLDLSDTQTATVSVPSSGDGSGSGGGTSVPEPSSLVLLLIAVVAALVFAQKTKITAL